jgi:DNA polymerase I-like protein with 3'-5' exonuclease and polymerase domains
MEKDMANTDYSQFELQAKKFLKEATDLLRENQREEAVHKLDAALVELKLMRTAVKHA